MKINFTFIIPHYNTPHLLLRCLNSIPSREDIQIIVIDDCSPDTPELIKITKQIQQIPYEKFG